MKNFKTAAAMLMLVMSTLLGNSALAQSSSEANCSVLYTDASVEVGAVCVTVNSEAENVFLDYLLIDDWKLSEANAWIGDSAGSIPTDGSGNPQISVFPHSASNLGDVNQHSFNIPFSELAVNADTFCNADVIVAASAVVTRTISGDTGGGSGGGKSDKSGKSGSDKSGKSSSDKSGKSSSSAKSSKSSEKSSKASSSSSKNSKKTSKNSSSSSKSSDKSSKTASSSSKSSGKSGKSSSSSKSEKSGKSGKSGAGNGGGTNPVTETFTAWAGDTAVGNGSYFSFSNDFCEPVEPILISVPNDQCYNVFAGDSGNFSPVGFDVAPVGHLNTFATGVGGFGTSFFPNNASSGGVVAILNGNGTMQVYITPPANYEVAMSNIYFGEAGSFVNVSPLEYGNSSLYPNAASVLVQLQGSLPATADIVVHATMCLSGTAF